MLICSADTLPHTTLSAIPTTPTEPLVRAEWNGTNDWFRPIETGTAVSPGSPCRTAEKLISIRIVAGRANHTSLLKWTMLLERPWSLNEVTLSRGGRLKWENANIRAGGYLDLAFHRSRLQLYLSISPSNPHGLWVINPPPLSHYTHIIHRLDLI